jgi:hypothetical protein
MLVNRKLTSSENNFRGSPCGRGIRCGPAWRECDTLEIEIRRDLLANGNLTVKSARKFGLKA